MPSVQAILIPPCGSWRDACKPAEPGCGACGWGVTHLSHTSEAGTQHLTLIL